GHLGVQERRGDRTPTVVVRLHQPTGTTQRHSRLRLEDHATRVQSQIENQRSIRGYLADDGAQLLHEVIGFRVSWTRREGARTQLNRQSAADLAVGAADLVAVRSHAD